MIYKKITLFTALFGTIFAYSAVVYDFSVFLKYANSLFFIQYGSLPNPVVTACFWGAFAFLICLVVAFKFYKSEKIYLQKFKYFVFFVSASCAFALANLFVEFKKFYEAGGGEYVGCSGQVVSNPFLTPCFGGSSIFVLLLISVLIQLRNLKSKTNEL